MHRILSTAACLLATTPLLAQSQTPTTAVVRGVVTSTPAPPSLGPVTQGALAGGGCSGTLVDFELGNGCVFSGEVPLSNEYAGLGVLFSGPSNVDGGAVLDECSNFGGQTALSGTNFLAFNFNAGMSNGGVPMGPETITFQSTVSNVSIYVSDAGVSMSMRMDAYDAGGGLITSSTVTTTPLVWEELSVSGAGIKSVVLTELTGTCCYIMDNLCFDAVCSPIGTSYCGPANVNGSGGPAVISACGSTSAAANDVLLETTDMPLGEFGYYINSQTQGFSMPPGSQGNLCLGGAIGRYSGSVMSTGNTGSFSLQLDLTTTPTPGGDVAVAPGETWYFTTWFRDGGSNNFSDGICITFQ